MPNRIHVPDLRLLRGSIAPRILDAARTASDALTRAHVSHALIGGLAVGAYGYVRATKDVDFLVGNEGYEHHGSGIVTFKPGVPIQVDGVPIDMLSDVDVDEEFLDEAPESEGIPIIEPEALVHLKLKAYRRRDKEDVIELLRAGLDEESIREYLEEAAPDLLERFDALADQADEEE